MVRMNSDPCVVYNDIVEDSSLALVSFPMISRRPPSSCGIIPDVRDEDRINTPSSLPVHKSVRLLTSASYYRNISAHLELLVAEEVTLR